MSKVNTITIDNVVMGHSINNDIVDFIKSKNFTQVIIFTQQAIQDSSKILIDQLITWALYEGVNFLFFSYLLNYFSFIFFFVL